MNKPTKVTRFLTKFAFDDLTECECGKKLFRYHNTSTNVFYAKCSNYDTKSKKINYQFVVLRGHMLICDQFSKKFNEK